jgi:hypothetical protein
MISFAVDVLQEAFRGKDTIRALKHVKDYQRQLRALTTSGEGTTLAVIPD